MVEVVDEVVDLGFEGQDVGGGIGLLGGEDAVDERFSLLLLLINQLHTYLSTLLLSPLLVCIRGRCPLKMLVHLISFAELVVVLKELCHEGHFVVFSVIVM